MKIFDTRVELLKLIKKNSVICELGTFKGDFAAIILSICKPKRLVLVDIWPQRVGSGDADGNNLEEHTGKYLRQYVEQRFKGFSEVTIKNANTLSALKSYPDNYFDMIYIDADHTYDAVFEDLKLSFKKVKKTGYIMGHDYEVNSNRTQKHFNFGVRQAVDDFCKLNHQSICAKTLDGLASYAIKIKK